MNKIIKLFLVVFLLLVGISGCGDDTVNDTGFSKEELWDYLDDYPRYLTNWAFSDLAIAFEEEGVLSFDYHGFSYDFTELISFSYEGNNIYKLEYENLYPEEFDGSIFYIDLNYKDNTRFTFGEYNVGGLEYVDYYADIGFTAKELLASIGRYETWREDNNEMVGYFFAKVLENNQFGYGIMNSGFGTIGDVASVKYHGYMRYTMSVDYEGYEGDEMNDPYDPYTIDYEIYYNHRTDYLLIKAYGEEIKFVPEIILEKDELFATLTKYGIWIEVSPSKDNHFLKVNDEGEFLLTQYHTGGDFTGILTDAENNGNMYYTLSVYYPGLDSGYYGEPTESFSAEYLTFFNPHTEVLIIEYCGEWIEFAPDKGLKGDQLLVELAKNELWVGEDMGGKENYFIKIYDGDKFDLRIIDNDFSHTGTIVRADYMGKMYYYINVDYPDIVDSAGNVYGETYTVFYDPDTGVLKMTIKGYEVNLKAKK